MSEKYPINIEHTTKQNRKVKACRANLSRAEATVERQGQHIVKLVDENARLKDQIQQFIWFIWHEDACNPREVSLISIAHQIGEHGFTMDEIKEALIKQLGKILDDHDVNPDDMERII